MQITVGLGLNVVTRCIFTSRFQFVSTVPWSRGPVVPRSDWARRWSRGFPRESQTLWLVAWHQRLAAILRVFTQPGRAKGAGVAVPLRPGRPGKEDDTNRYPVWETIQSLNALRFLNNRPSDMTLELALLDWRRYFPSDVLSRCNWTCGVK